MHSEEERAEGQIFDLHRGRPSLLGEEVSKHRLSLTCITVVIFLSTLRVLFCASGINDRDGSVPLYSNCETNYLKI